jgi:hypothetical protein
MEAAEPASSALRAAAWAATSDGAGATLLAPTAPGLAAAAGLFAAGLLAWPWVALNLGLGFGLDFDLDPGFDLELGRRPRGSTTAVASTVTGELPVDSGPGLELGAGAGALTGGGLVDVGGGLLVVGGAGVLDVFAGGVLPVTPSGVADVPEGVSCEPAAGAGGGELPVEDVEPAGSPAASAPGEIGPSPDRVKPPPARTESSACQARRRGPLSDAMRRPRSSWGALIVVYALSLPSNTGFAHCIWYRQPSRRG